MTAGRALDVVMGWPLVAAVFGPTFGEWDDVVDTVRTGVTAEVTDVRRCEDGAVDALSGASIDALVVLAHHSPRTY
jgi:hypothetical protein